MQLNKRKIAEIETNGIMIVETQINIMHIVTIDQMLNPKLVHRCCRS
jgi:hypothetical protein